MIFYDPFNQIAGLYPAKAANASRTIISNLSIIAPLVVFILRQLNRRKMKPSYNELCMA